ncbi:MAG: restriction endonuclease subunit S [Tissierellales bacterium]|nr:restriction endonuclease subunit S [Tissierellales bacterium]
MSEWKEGVLSDIVDIIMGQSPKGETCNSSGHGKPLLNGPTEFGIKFPSPVQYTVTNTKIAKAGDILFCVRGSTTGRMNWADQEYVIGRGVAAIRHKEGKNYQAFTKSILDYNLPILLASATGSTFPNVSRDQLEQLDILLPPLPEQCAIAAVLSSLDDKIDLLHRQNKTLEAMAETLFRQWFVEEADKGWEEGTVSDLCDHYKAGVKPQESPLKVFSHYSIPSLDNGMNPVHEAGSEIQSNKYSVIPNCLLFSKLNPHKDKRIWLILDNLEEDSICSTEFQVVLPKDKKYLIFIYCWLSCSPNYNEIASGVGGTSGSHQRIDPADIFNFPCPKISDYMFDEFNTKVKPQFIQIQINRIQIRTLEKLRNTLLPKLMSGEVRVECS